MSNPLR